jgi:hypothetical protein
MNVIQFLQGDNGDFSSSRLAFLLWAIGVLIVWCVSSFKKGSLVCIPDSVSTILGILMTGKVVQKFGEKPAAPSIGDKPAAQVVNTANEVVQGNNAIK